MSLACLCPFVKGAVHLADPVYMEEDKYPAWLFDLVEIPKTYEVLSPLPTPTLLVSPHLKAASRSITSHTRQHSVSFIPVSLKWRRPWGSTDIDSHKARLPLPTITQAGTAHR
jgi:hypothetical protein